MVAVRQNFIIEQGSPFEKSVLWARPDNSGVYQPVNLVGGCDGPCYLSHPTQPNPCGPHR